MINYFASIIYLIIYLCVLLCLLLSQYRHNKRIGPASTIIITYICYAVFSIILYNASFTYYGKLTLIPLLYLVFMYVIALLPSIQYENSNIYRIQIPSYYIIYSYIAIYLLTTIVLLPKIIVDLPDALRMLLYEDVGAEMYYERRNAMASDGGLSGLYGFCSALHNFLQDINFMFMFLIISLPIKKWVPITLIITIIIDMLLAISSGGRTSVIMNILTLLMGYALFNKYWNRSLRRRIKYIALGSLILISVPFIALTISRFADSQSGFTGSIIEYAGQSTLNFDLYVLDNNVVRDGDRTMTVFKQLLGFDSVPRDFWECRLKHPGMKIDDSYFSSFVGDFVLDFGPLVASLLFIGLSLLLLFLTRTSNHTIPFHKLVLIYANLCVCSQGGMYLYNYSFINNWRVIFFILLYFICLVDYSISKKRLYIKEL